jgi:NADH-quinone oxidoreductase subunit M
MLSNHYLTLIWLAPLVAALVVCFLDDHLAIKKVSLAGASISLALTLYLVFAKFVTGDAGSLQFKEVVPLIPQLNVNYTVGVDGISLVMLLLTAIIIFTGVLASWGVTNRAKEFFALLLLLVSGVFGVFMSFDLFVFFVFYEIAVLPMYLLIGIWGTGPKEYSAMKLTLMLMGGSAFVLVGMLALYYGNGGQSFNIFDMAKAGVALPKSFQILWFPVLYVGFGVLAAMWPLHTWSPDGHASAPTAVSMLHAGVLMKLGAYGCLRIAMFLLPAGAQYWGHTLAALCLVNVVYGSIGAAAQTDLKYVTAYSSVSHMGIVLLGLATLNPVGINGAVLQMFAHGIMTGLFFALIGMTYGRTHTRIMTEMGGLAKIMPYLAVSFVIGGMASLGLPGLSGFVAELQVFLGAYRGDAFMKIVALISITSIVFTAVYVLRVIQRTFYGPVKNQHFTELTDASFVERVPLAVLIATMLIVGIYPYPVVHLIDQAVVPIYQHLQLGLLP